METLKVFFDNLQSKPLYLNHTKIKSIQVCLDPVSLPNIKPVYKLNDNSHHCEIIFSKETMKAMCDMSDEIIGCLSAGTEKSFFLNNEIKVFSERNDNQCAVISFLSIRGVKINMMNSTFSEMVNSSIILSLMYDRLVHKVNETAKNLKQLLDILLVDYTRHNVNNPDFKNFLRQLHQNASSLCGSGSTLSNANNQNLNTSDTSYDDDKNDANPHYDHYCDYLDKREDEDDFDDDMHDEY